MGIVVRKSVLRVSGSVVLAMLSAENESMRDCGDHELGLEALEAPVCFRSDPPQMARRARRFRLSFVVEHTSIIKTLDNRTPPFR